MVFEVSRSFITALSSAGNVVEVSRIGEGVGASATITGQGANEVLDPDLVQFLAKGGVPGAVKPPRTGGTRGGGGGGTSPPPQAGIPETPVFVYT